MNQQTLQNQSREDLEALHASLEKRLQELQAARSLSPEETYEIQIIKKRKLAIKDQLQSMGPS